MQLTEKKKEPTLIRLDTQRFIFFPFCLNCAVAVRAHFPTYYAKREQKALSSKKEEEEGASQKRGEMYFLTWGG